MDADRLFDAVGDIGDDLVLEAAGRTHRKRRGVRALRFAAAAALVIAALGVFLSTSAGRAFADMVRTAYEDVIERLFPPKEMSMMLEGLESTADVEAHGEITTNSPRPWADYVIYVEPDGNDITQSENYFRMSRSANGLPEMYLEIVQIPDITPNELADEIIAQEAQKGELMHSGSSTPPPDGQFLTLRFTESPYGSGSWDDCIREYHICENGLGGCFKITVQYFFEAAEGFGTRCNYYLSTFEVLPRDG